MSSDPGPSRVNKNGRGPWGKINALTFDGGGIRGYYSLLQLRKLMECIAEEERNVQQSRSEPAEFISSFSPLPVPPNVSHSNPPDLTPFLPCHYFDYISGTSTGSLITIMLGRFRMTVDDCISEYEKLAGDVFGHPRTFHQVGSLGAFIHRHKFSASKLERAIKDVVQRRGETPNNRDDSEAVLFGTPRGLCRALIFVQRRTLSGDNNSSRAAWTDTVIYRSYDNFRRAAPAGGRVRPRASVLTGPRTPGQSTTLAVWKLARAATAAYLYFKPLQIALEDGEIVRGKRSRKALTGGVAVLTDGGFGPQNNPSEEVYNELKTILPDSKSVQVFVSIGTARSPPRPDQNAELRLRTVLRFAVDRVGDPEASHRRMEIFSAADGFLYYRFNEPNALEGVDLDDWKPRGSGANSGIDTMEKIRSSFNRYWEDAEVQEDFRNCARELVAIRRERTKDKSLWERFALGTTYTCREDRCKYEPDQTWEYRDQFIRHLVDDHGITISENQTEALRTGGLRWDYKKSKTAQAEEPPQATPATQAPQEGDSSQSTGSTST
ncbi:acyl transferase/acyl hydrolase/lysophospholipase [Cladorrhinum sp. PSN259]|nr:acyl transferase/acyl hydrolase/lysophospholipase [Cladorrhinum sp. PSN259]